MCDPVTLGTTALVSSVVGTGMQAYGQYQGAKTEKANLAAQEIEMRRQAEAQRTNAAIAKINAGAALTIGELNAKTIETLGSINASISETIGDINAGITTTMADLNWQIADGNYNLMTDMADDNLQIAERQAEYLEESAQQALVQGQRAEQSSRLSYANLKGAQRAQLAANGVALNEGSSLSLLTTTDYFNEVDAAAIGMNAINEALGYRTQAHAVRAEGINDRAGRLAQATAYRAEAMGSRLASTIEAGNTRLNARVDALNTRTGATFDALNTRISASQQALNMTIAAAGYEAEATAQIAGAEQVARNARAINPAFRAATTLVSGAGQVAGQWYNYRKAGVF